MILAKLFCSFQGAQSVHSCSFHPWHPGCPSSLQTEALTIYNQFCICKSGSILLAKAFHFPMGSLTRASGHTGATCSHIQTHTGAFLERQDQMHELGSPMPPSLLYSYSSLTPSWGLLPAAEHPELSKFIIRIRLFHQNKPKREILLLACG